jgi:hypothetical protein
MDGHGPPARRGPERTAERSQTPAPAPEAPSRFPNKRLNAGR